jgi:catechol 2,3-dioxygenase-like lactoylglutathione lyase family enzyme
MTLGAIEAVRVFTSKLAVARRFYADSLGLPEMLATDTIAMFDTGQAELIVEYIDPDDPEAKGLVGRFTAFSFTVTNMETAVANLRVHPIEWLGLPEWQPWGGLLSHFKDPDGNILTLVQYP